jgi:hypothetical protein
LNRRDACASVGENPGISMNSPRTRSTSRWSSGAALRPSSVLIEIVLS